MSRYFIDTSYVQARLSHADQWHARAVAWERTAKGRFWTTDYILLETANAFSKQVARPAGELAVEELRRAHDTTIVPQSRDLFDRGWELFRRHRDKDWSLTDCISFVVMADFGLKDALSSDRHFEQAGYRALLLHEPESISTP